MKFDVMICGSRVRSKERDFRTRMKLRAMQIFSPANTGPSDCKLQDGTHKLQLSRSPVLCFPSGASGDALRSMRCRCCRLLPARAQCASAARQRSAAASLYMPCGGVSGEPKLRRAPAAKSAAKPSHCGQARPSWQRRRRRGTHMRNVFECERHENFDSDDLHLVTITNAH